MGEDSRRLLAARMIILDTYTESVNGGFEAAAIVSNLMKSSTYDPFSPTRDSSQVIEIMRFVLQKRDFRDLQDKSFINNMLGLFWPPQ